MDKFDVHFDPQLRRQQWTMRGFWTLDDVAAFATALRTSIAPLGPPPLHFDALADSRNFPVQAHEVAEALGQIERVGRTIQIGRFAVVVGSMTNKLQAQRTLTGDNVRVFLDYDAAVAWLDTAPGDD